jgi:hypothetical protein
LIDGAFYEKGRKNRYKFYKIYSRTLPRRNVYWLGISIVVEIPFVFATK